MSDLQESNDVKEIGALYDITKENLKSYQGFVNKVKRRLNKLDWLMIAAEEPSVTPKTQGLRDVRTNSNLLFKKDLRSSIGLNNKF